MTTSTTMQVLETYNLLIENKGKVVTFEQIADKILGINLDERSPREQRDIKRQISYIIRTLKKRYKMPYIQNISKKGYVLL